MWICFVLFSLFAHLQYFVPEYHRTTSVGQSGLHHWDPVSDIVWSVLWKLPISRSYLFTNGFCFNDPKPQGYSYEVFLSASSFPWAPNTRFWMNVCGCNTNLLISHTSLASFLIESTEKIWVDIITPRFYSASPYTKGNNYAGWWALTSVHLYNYNQNHDPQHVHPPQRASLCPTFQALLSLPWLRPMTLGNHWQLFPRHQSCLSDRLWKVQMSFLGFLWGSSSLRCVPMVPSTLLLGGFLWHSCIRICSSIP